MLPSSAAEVQAVVRLCARDGVPFVARGHGTGLSGGALPVAGGVVIALSRLNRMLDVDIPNQRVTVEPGVTNLDITRQVAPFGYYYAPDPSSQQVCSIGGNVAENSGGAHCLKYGFTVHHVLGVEAVLPDGELVHLGGALARHAGPDLLGAARRLRRHARRRHEGRRVRILRRPETRADAARGVRHRSTPAAPRCPTIIAAGIIPAAVEMMDALAIQRGRSGGAPELSRRRHRPDRRARRPRRRSATRCSTIVEAHLPAARRDDDRGRADRRAARADLEGPQGGVRGDGPRVAELLRAGRRRAAHEAARGAGRIRALEARSGLRIGNVFHAGDGNLHPLICYDERDARARRTRPTRSPAEILSYCIEAGGSITGEHGVGADKAQYMPTMFTPDDLDADAARARARSIRRASAIRARCFRRRGCAAKCPGPYRAASGRDAPAWRSGSDGRSDATIDRRRDAARSIEPATAAEVAAALARASDARQSVVIRGAGTKIGWGRAAARDRRRPRARAAEPRRSRIEHGDLTATIEAGATLRDVNAALARHGQWLPLDPPFADRATIGGIARDQRQRPAAPPLRHAARSRDRHRSSRPTDGVLVEGRRPAS